MSALALAFITGLVFSALFGNALEWKVGEPACLREPFVSPQNITKSLLQVLAAGPYLLVGETRMLMRIHGGDAMLVTTAIVLASLWSLACGILWLEFFMRISQSW